MKIKSYNPDDLDDSAFICGEYLDLIEIYCFGYAIAICFAPVKLWRWVRDFSIKDGRICFEAPTFGVIILKEKDLKLK